MSSCLLKPLIITKVYSAQQEEKKRRDYCVIFLSFVSKDFAPRRLSHVCPLPSRLAMLLGSPAPKAGDGLQFIHSRMVPNPLGFSAHLNRKYGSGNVKIEVMPATPPSPVP